MNENLFTIAEFCQRQGMSTATYYGLKRRGLGPVELRYGFTVRISPRAEADWRAARETPDEEVHEKEVVLKARGRRAAARAVASPAHIADRRIAAREKVA
jgi:hypothetical protein